MSNFKGAVAALALVGGTAYLAGEFISGKGDCFRAIVPGLDSEDGITKACFGFDAEEHTEAEVTGPEIRAARLLNNRLSMTFGQIEVDVVFPLSNDSRTKLDYDLPFWGNAGPIPFPQDFAGDVDTTILVNPDQPVSVWFTPCIRLSEDYEEDGLLQPVNESLVGETESYLDVSYKVSPDQKQITEVVVQARGIEACFTHIPTENSNGDTNGIPYEVGDGAQAQIPAPLTNTFDVVLRNLAMGEVMASDCVGALIEEESAKESVKKYVAGALAAELGGVFIDPSAVTIEFTDQDKIIDDYKKEYWELVEEYKNLDKTLPGTGDEHDIDIKFAPNINEISDCRQVAGS
jgi:hypothetical protein